MGDNKQIVEALIQLKKVTDLHSDILSSLGDTETRFYKTMTGQLTDKLIGVLPGIIQPLIPEPIKGDKGDSIKGDDGNDYILTEQDKRDIALAIEVPVVEKVVEKIEVIREVPIITNEIKEVALSENAYDIVTKLESLEGESRLDASAIKNLPEFSGKSGFVGPRNITNMLSGGANITITGNGTLTSPYIINGSGGGGAVDSVNGQTGVVVLGTDDISDTALNRYTNDTDIARLADTTGTNTGDNATNTQYSSLVTNATHTGDATGSEALSVVRIQGTAIPAPTVGDDQKFIKYDHGTTAFIYDTVSGGVTQAQVLAINSLGVLI